MEDEKLLSDYDVWKFSYLQCSRAISEKGWSVPSTPAPPDKWSRPLPSTRSARVLHDIEPIRTARRPAYWSADDGSWESDGNARTMMKRLGREDPSEYIMTVPSTLANSYSASYIPDYASLASLAPSQSLPALGRSSSTSSLQPLEERARANVRRLDDAAFRPMRQQLRAIDRMGKQVSKQPLSKIRGGGASLPMLVHRPIRTERSRGTYVELLEVAKAVSKNSPCRFLAPLAKGAISNQIY